MAATSLLYLYLLKCNFSSQLFFCCIFVVYSSKVTILTTNCKYPAKIKLFLLYYSSFFRKLLNSRLALFVVLLLVKYSTIIIKGRCNFCRCSVKFEFKQSKACVRATVCCFTEETLQVKAESQSQSVLTE